MLISEIQNESQLPNDILEYIYQNCSDILTQYQKTGHVFYRGIASSVSYTIANPPVDRAPLHSKELPSKLFDNALNKLGFKALRNNSIFVTSDPLHALDFGPLYVAFPVNGFVYTYPKYPDLVLEYNMLDDLIDTEKFFDGLEEFLNLVRNNEIKLHVKEKYVIHLLNSGAMFFRILDMITKLPDDVHNYFKILKQRANTLENYIDLDKFNLEFSPSNTNIDQALIDNYETYIHGKCVLVSIKHYTSIMSNLKLNKVKSLPFAAGIGINPYE